jgi:photosystem II stability/assembly factor-like uncharacterized protein
MKFSHRWLFSLRIRLETLESRDAPSASDWIPVQSGTTTSLSDVSGISGGSYAIALEAGPVVLRSTDGQATWQARSTVGQDALLGVGGGFRDYVVGESGTIEHTPDNGTTWELRNSGTTATLRAISQFNNGYFVVGDGGTILHSTDGTNWTSQISGTTQGLYAVFGDFSGAAIIVVGTGGTILRSTDGGTTWLPQISCTTRNLRDAVDQGTFGDFVVGDGGLILRSTDQGISWSPIISGTSQQLNGITGDDSGDLWAVGAAGTIVLSSNQGANWTVQRSGTTVDLHAVWANTSTDVVAVGDAGTILRFEGTQLTATGADAGGLPEVRVFDSRTGQLVRSFLAYDASFHGGVRVAIGDVNLDGTDDIITAAGPGGGPHVKVFDGKTGNLIREFFAYDASFTGGVFIAFGLQANIHAMPPVVVPEIVTGADAGGGPHVKVFNGQTLNTITSFFAYDASFRGGVRVATLPSNSSGGPPQIVTGAGPGGGPHVKLFDSNGDEVQSFFAYDASFAGGVYVASAGGTIVTTPGSGGGPHVRVFDGNGHLSQEFFAYDAAFRGGVRAAIVGDINGDNNVDLVTSPGPTGGPDIRYFNLATGKLINEYFSDDASNFNGIFVAASRNPLIQVDVP